MNIIVVFLALYLGEIVRLIIVDLVQRSILFPGRMQKSPSIRPDYNIFLILRGKERNIRKVFFIGMLFFSLKAVSMQNMWPILKMIQVKERELKENKSNDFILAEDLSITTAILTSIGINEPSYDDCYTIREVCKTVSLRAAKLAAAGNKLSLNIHRKKNKCLLMNILAIAVLINRLNMPSVTIGVDGTLFRHHDKFRQNLSRTLSRLVPRTVSR
jgi:hexokinase